MEKNINIETFSIINPFLETIKEIDSLSVVNKVSFLVFQFIKDNEIEIVHFEIDEINKCIILKIDYLNTFQNKNVILDAIKKEAKNVDISVKYSLPSIEEFKFLAKKYKEIGEYSSLGHAQNGLATSYGYKNYQTIKPVLKPVNMDEIRSKLLLRGRRGYGVLEMHKIYSSFITVCFGTKPEANKNRIEYEYEINLNDFPFSEENKNFFYSILCGINSINNLFQEAFFNEISLDYGFIQLKSNYELTYPFGKDPDLLKDIFDEEVIKFIFSIKNKNKESIEKNKLLNEDKTLDEKIETFCLVSFTPDYGEKQYFLIDAIINKRNNTVRSTIYEKFGGSHIPLSFDKDFDKNLLEEQTIEDLILEYENRNGFKLKKESDLSIIKMYFSSHLFQEDRISLKLKSFLAF
ncbi:hypothetical protein [Arcobacter cloacae]|uniref:Uncharacterized protein n=1 Tax=Arcobacter cloacae TaxID=1054034 RepID=A0A4Q0ZKR3_9BACT|nr:hypothetical protein [Arcobacter cloacae]RXJ84088.1 hypothetical protein CRU90_06725 [Arcobacter cloacae]